LPAFITVGGGGAGDVDVLEVEVEVVLEVVLAVGVVLGVELGFDVVGVVVLDAEVVVDPPLLPHAARIPMLAARTTSFGVIDTARAGPRRGRCDEEATSQSVSSPPPAVIGR
jgi:hypothetical protein